MSTGTHEPLQQWVASPEALAEAITADVPGPGGDWPHTTRVVPWLIAGFLFMAFLVPFDSVQLPIHLPLTPTLDRAVLGILALCFVVVWAVTPKRTAPLRRMTAIDGAVLFFLVAAVITVIANYSNLATLGDLSTSVKKIGLLISYVLFFFIVKRSIRPSELRAYGKLFVILGCGLAVGTIYQYRTNVNLFFSWTSSILQPLGFSVAPPPPNPTFGRALVSGPTLHPLVIVTMLSLALPFSAMALVEAKHLKARCGYAVITALLFAGTVATDRKSAVIVPIATLITIVVYRGRQAVKLLPLGVVMIGLIPAFAPGALGSIVGQLAPSRVSTDPSTTGRESDYNAASAYLRDGLVFGRGYGGFDPPKYRILDNSYLNLAIQEGALGIGAYLVLLFGTIGTAHRLIRSRDPRRAPPAMAAAAGAVSLLIGSALYDLLGYPQSPYLFFFLLAICVVASREAPPNQAFNPPPRLGRRKRKRLLKRTPLGA